MKTAVKGDFTAVDPRDLHSIELSGWSTAAGESKRCFRGLWEEPGGYSA
jgi:hypothetical protein